MKKKVHIAIIVFIVLLSFSGCANINSQTATDTVTPSTSSTEPSIDTKPDASTPTPSTVSTSLSTQKTSPEWRYYLVEDGLYRTDQNSKDMIKISGQRYTSDIIITDDWIYFSNNNQLYRMDNENGQELLIDKDCWCLSFNNDWLYYISNNDVFKMNPESKVEEQLFQCKCKWMILSEKYIFYALDVPVNDEEWLDDGPWLLGELHRVDLNGENDVNLGTLVTELNVYENTIYFADGEDFYLYSMNPETLEKAAVYEGHFIEHLYLSDGYAFYILDRNLFRLSLAESKMTQLTKGYWNSCLGVLDGYVYGHNEHDGLYRIKIDGIELEKME